MARVSAVYWNTACPINMAPGREGHIVGESGERGGGTPMRQDTHSRGGAKLFTSK